MQSLPPFRHVFSVFVSLLVLAAAARAQQPSGTPVPAPSPSFSVPDLDYFVHALPPPPRSGSFRDRMDYRDALARQQTATAKDMASIQETYRFTVFYYAKVFGPNFDAKHYPKTAAFFAKVTNTANGVIGELKDHYKRLRPFAAYPDKIQLYVRNEPGYGYPSGHTTRSRLDAFIVAALNPPSRTPIFKAAELVATDRILAGEHYLTDLEAGRRLGKLLFGILSKDPEFQKELSALKASSEWSPPPKPMTPAGN